MKKTLNFIIASTITLSVSICTAILYYSSVLPDSFHVNSSRELNLSANFPITAVAENIESASLSSEESCHENSSETATLKLFGIVPLKEVEVIKSETPLLIPGGTPFGIKILIDGVMVVGIGEVNSDGKISSPAKDAGIEAGDIIVSIAGQEISSNEDIQEVISESDGNAVEVVINRDEIPLTVELQPAYSKSDNCWQAGIWVRDSSAGIGTVTFYEPSTSRFGGLGHPVCDVDTSEILPLSSGEVVGVDITGVKKSSQGNAGELQGMFSSDNAIGSLYANNEYGVFGTLDNCPSCSDAIPMGLKQEIQLGEASVITTIDDGPPQEYSISIEKIDYRSDNANKNMIIKVTDEKLLSLTGGIVQGMSGSPIIQNGKLIGAVTHVFINEPSKGYAVFCENMYEYGLD